MKRIRYAALGSLLVLGLAGNAVAADLSVDDMEAEIATPEGTYRIWIGGAYFNAPVANGLGTVGDAANFLFEQQTDNGAALANPGLSGGVSIWAPADTHLLYLELDGDFVHAENNYSVVVDAPGIGTILDFLPITGAPSPGQVADVVNGNTVDSATTIDYGRVNAAVGLGFAPDVPVALGLVASAGLLHLESLVTAPTDPFPNSITLDETVTMYSAGPMIAGQWTNPVSDAVGLTVSGRAAVLGAFGRLEATQTVESLFFDPVFNTTAEAFALAGLVEAQASLDVAAGDNLSLFVFGGVGARNDYFSIVNPRSGPGLFADNPASYDPGPVRLEQSLLLTAKAGVGLGGTF